MTARTLFCLPGHYLSCPYSILPACSLPTASFTRISCLHSLPCLPAWLHTPCMLAHYLACTHTAFPARTPSACMYSSYPNLSAKMIVHKVHNIYMYPGVTKGCRLSLLTNSALVIRVQMREEGGVAGSQPMNKAVHITWHGAQISFGDLPLYLTYTCTWRPPRSPGPAWICPTRSSRSSSSQNYPAVCLNFMSVLLREKKINGTKLKKVVTLVQVMSFSSFYLQLNIDKSDHYAIFENLLHR